VPRLEAQVRCSVRVLARHRVTFVLHDRDASFTAASGAVFHAAGVRVVRSAIQAPRNELDHGTLGRQLPA
jgi:hypothetical protein